MVGGLVAKARAEIDAPIAVVWDAFVNPETIKQYMFGTDVISGWKVTPSYGRASGREDRTRTRARFSS